MGNSNYTSPAFTPGPWVYEWRKNNQMFRISSPGAMITDIAYIFEQEADGEATANARLIAAAPDLLECVKKVALVTSEGEIKELERVEMHRMATKAIEQAT